MDLLIELTYAAIVFAAFKLFRIPVNKWTVTTAVVGGIFVVGSIFLAMAYFHPYTPQGRIFFQTTPIMPQVRGKVITVPIRESVPLKKGDVLFTIDPTPYQAAFDAAQAKLQSAKDTAAQLRTRVDNAQAQVKESKAALDLTAKTEKRMRQLLQEQSIAQQRYDHALAQLQETQQVHEGAQADLANAEGALTTQDALIQEAQAQVEKARFDLDSTVVRAPTDGYVVQVRLRPGMMAVPLPLRPVMTFVSNEETYLVGAFKQNPLQNIRVGDKAEVIFPAIPGRAFRGHVTQIIAALGEGQLQPSSEMLRFEGELPEGRVPVFIELDDSISEYDLPAGVAARVAVYSDKMDFLAPIRQILLRMMSWKNVVCFEVL